MDDLKEKADQYKDQFMSKASSVDQKGKFFTYSKPLTDAIDNGSLFTKGAGILYQMIGGLLLIFPLYLLYNAIFKDDILNISQNIEFVDKHYKAHKKAISYDLYDISKNFKIII